MFDPSEFDKLNSAFDGVAANFESKLAAVFKSLTPTMQKAFKKNGPLSELTKEFDHMGSTAKDVDAAMEKLNQQMSFLSSHKNTVANLIDKLKQKRQEDNEGLKAIIAQSKNTQDLAASEKFRNDVLAKHAARLKVLTDRQDALNAAYATTAQKLKIIDKLSDHRKLSGIPRDKSLEQHEKELAAKHARALKNANSHRIFGISHDHAERHVNDLLKRFAWGAIAVKIAEVAVRGLEKAYTNLRNSGQAASQAVPNAGGSIADSAMGLFQNGVLAAPGTYAANMGALGNTLGSTDVPHGLTMEATRLNAQYKLTSEQASTLVGLTYRMSGYSAKASTAMLEMGRNIAHANGFAMGTAMKDMADNAQIFATYATRGVASFEDGAITVRQMGTSLQTMNGFANKLVDDFDSSLKMQATIQSFAPGVDFTKVMMDSQFGANEGTIAKDLQAALTKGGIHDVGSMPRSVRNMLSNQLGIPMDQLENILKSKDGKGQAKLKGADVDYNDKTQSVFNSFGDLAASAIRAATSLNFLAATAFLFNTKGSGIANGVKSMFGGGGAAGAGGAAASVGSKIPWGGLGAGSALAGVATGGMDYINQKQNGATTGQALGHSAIVGGTTGLLAFGLGALGAAFGGPIGAALGGMAGSYIGNAFGGSIADSVVPVEKHHRGGIAGMIDAFTSIGSNEVPAILEKGERVLTVPQTRNLSRFADTAVNMDKTNASIIKNAVTTTTPASNEATPQVQTDEITELLTKILRATQDGHVIQMDGKKVGASIVTANRER